MIGISYFFFFTQNIFSIIPRYSCIFNKKILNFVFNHSSVKIGISRDMSIKYCRQLTALIPNLFLYIYKL